jgi:hypothetical protein
MSVDVKTNANDVGVGGVGVLMGVGAAVAGAVYWKFKSNMATWQVITRSSIILSFLIMAIVMWLLLTNVEKLSKLVLNNQLVCLVLSSIVALGLLSGAYAYSKTSDNQ